MASGADSGSSAPRLLERGGRAGRVAELLARAAEFGQQAHGLDRR